MEMPSNSTTSVVLPGRSNVYVSGVIGLIFVAVLSWIWIPRNSTSNEPPELWPKVPFIGHLLGMMQHQAEYFVQLKNPQSWPIFTLKIFSSRIYVVTSPELVQAVFRNSKAISFDPIAAKGSARILQIEEETRKKLETRPDDKHNSYVDLTSKGMHVSMRPGTPLLEMNSRALNRFAVFLEEIGAEGKELDLYRWVRDHFMLASAEAMYGEENPISEDHSLIQSLEDFESSIGLLFLNVFPSFTARKGVQARLAYGRAFKSYYARGLHKNASALIQDRYRDITSSGCSADDIATFEIAILMATTMNTINSAFWLLCQIFSSPPLLASLRAEIQSISTSSTTNGTRTLSLDVSRLQNACPLLTSTWQETLRVYDVVVSQRVVLSDVSLSAYTLRKDAIVQIPSSLLHHSATIWGPDSHVFKADRFLKSNIEALSREQKKAQKQAFIPFGGGAVLCPGRHFAAVETLGVVAALVLGFDISMRDGAPLGIPRGKRQEMGVAVKIPEEGLAVRVTRRKAYENVKWEIDVGGDVGENDMVF